MPASTERFSSFCYVTCTTPHPSAHIYSYELVRWDTMMANTLMIVNWYINKLA